MTNPTPHGQVPPIQRYKIGYHSDEWGVRSSMPDGISDPSGQWVLYKDHIAALRTTPNQQGAPEALRLAATLRLHILHNDPGEPVLWVSAVLNKRGIHGAAEFQDEGKRTESTRLAIVKCAAAIGEKMP